MVCLELFEKTVLWLKELQKTDQLNVVFNPNGRPNFIFDETSILKEFSTANEASVKDVRRLINSEIPALISNRLAEEPFYLLMELPFFEQDDKKAAKELVKNKLRVVEDTLINTHMKYSYLIKKTAKMNALQDIDWEINKKIYDDEVGDLAELKYATIRLKTASSTKFPNALMQLMSLNSATESSTFICDSADIKHMIGVLKDIQSALEEE